MSRKTSKKDGHARRRLPYRRGVGALLFNAQGEVLVARRIDTPGDAWQLPQGGVDRDEKPRQALFRELEEEIGTRNAVVIGKSRRWYRYDLPDAVAGKVWGGKYRGQKQRWFALRFLGKDSDIDLAASHSPEFDAWRWTPLESIPALAVSFKRDLYSALVAEFLPLAMPHVEPQLGAPDSHLTALKS